MHNVSKKISSINRVEPVLHEGVMAEILNKCLSLDECGW